MYMPTRRLTVGTPTIDRQLDLFQSKDRILRILDKSHSFPGLLIF